MTPRSRRRRTIALVVAGLAALWLVVAAWLVLSARADVEAGADDLRAVRREASIASLVEPERTDELAGAADRFARASDRLGSPVLAPVRILPVATSPARPRGNPVPGPRSGCRPAWRRRPCSTIHAAPTHSARPRR